MSTFFLKFYLTLFIFYNILVGAIRETPLPKEEKMYLFAIILIALFAIFGIIFGVQNAAPVEVHFFANEFTVPLMLVMVISFAGGTILAFILAVVDEIKLRGRIGKQQREVDTLKKELGTLKTIPTQEEKNED